MSVEQVPNPEEKDAAAANGGGGGGGGGGGSSNSNSHNSAQQASIEEIKSVIDQLARSLPAPEGG